MPKLVSPSVARIVTDVSQLLRNTTVVDERVFVVVPKVKGVGVALESRTVIEVFQVSYGFVPKATRFGVSLGAGTG